MTMEAYKRLCLSVGYGFEFDSGMLMYEVSFGSKYHLVDRTIFRLLFCHCCYCALQALQIGAIEHRMGLSK